MAQTQLSLNQIILYFAKMAASLQRVHSFYYGPLEDVAMDQQPIYPLMWMEPVTSTLRKDSLVLRHKIYIFDLVQKDLSNRQDIMSDSLRTCQEIKAYIFKDFFYDIFPTDESDLEPQFHRLDDDVEGYSMELELQLDWLADVCTIPGLYPSGATFVAGPGYYNVQATGYLPLAGGQLTGPLTGTSAYFNTYFSAGTPLETIIYSIASGSTGSGGFSGWTGSSGISSIVANNGSNSTVSGNFSIAGGRNNIISNSDSFIGAGYSNEITASYSFIGNGYANKVSGGYASVLGGLGNSATTSYTSVLGGNNNLASGNGAVVVGGQSNVASGSLSFLAGGFNNIAAGQYSFLGGGQTNRASGLRSSTLGGNNNNVSSTGNNSAIIGGDGNTVSGGASTVAGGVGNTVSSVFSTIAGGQGNIISANYSFIGGGFGNRATAIVATIAGGDRGYASGTRSFIGGGFANSATTGNAGVVGGSSNIANGSNTVVIGGSGINGSNNDSVYVPFLFVKSASTTSTIDSILVRNTTGEVLLRSITGITSGITSSASNGLNTTGGSIQLGGDLIKDTTIGGGAYGLHIPQLDNFFSSTDNDTIFNAITGDIRLSSAFGGITLSGNPITIYGPTNINGSLVVTGSGRFNSVSATTLSAGTINSGSTNLYNIFQPLGANSVIGNGTNTYTGGSFFNQTVNVSALTINSITVSGNSVFSSFSSTTSGGTNVIRNGGITGAQVLQIQNTGGTVTAFFTGQGGLSATSITASTYYNIPTIFGSGANGAGGTITTGVTGYVTMGNAGRITGWDLVGSTSGTITMDVWKSTNSLLPTVANTITDNSRPQITSGVYSGSTNLSAWSGLTYAAGDIFGFNVVSVTGFTTITLTMRGVKQG